MLGPWTPPPTLGSPGAAPAAPPPAGGRGRAGCGAGPTTATSPACAPAWPSTSTSTRCIVRIAAVVLLFSGPGVFAYVLAWIFVPAEPGPARYGEPQAPIDRKDRATQIFGIVLLVLAVSVIWGDWWSPARGWLFPLGLMALGAWLLLRRDRDDDDAARRPSPRSRRCRRPAAPWSWTPPPTTVPVDAAGPDAATDAGDDDDRRPTADVDDRPPSTPTTPTSTRPRVQPTTDAGDGGGGGWGAAAHRALGRAPAAGARHPSRPSPAPTDRDRRHRHRHRHLVGPGVFGVLLIWAGVAWLTGVGLTTGLAVGLLILGLGLRARLLRRRLAARSSSRRSLVARRARRHRGHRHPALGPDRRAALVARPRRRAARTRYEVSMGEGTLDLSELGMPAGDDATCEATVGLGHLVVLVPEDQDLVVNTEVGAGEAVVFGEQQNGVGFETHERATAATAAPSSSTSRSASARSRCAASSDAGPDDRSTRRRPPRLDARLTAARRGRRGRRGRCRRR